MLFERKTTLSVWLVLLIFAVHSLLRFAGLSNPLFVPLSMVMLWPLPWLLMSGEFRRSAGFRKPRAPFWYASAAALGLALVMICAAFAWLVFGSGSSNWFLQHAVSIREATAQMPSGATQASLFMSVTIPAMVFSPLGEEVFYRGLMQKTFSRRWNDRIGMLGQASAFSLVHLSHYGLVPFQPALMLVWLPSMFAVAVALACLVRASGSIWCAVIAHSVFNLGMNLIVFVAFPDHIGV